jgi:hypothetical protein
MIAATPLLPLAAALWIAVLLGIAAVRTGDTSAGALAAALLIGSLAWRSAGRRSRF